MVCSNYGYPDPDKPSEDLSPNNDLILASDTDTEDEENAHEYQPLPTQDTQEAEDPSESSDIEEGAAAAPNNDSLPTIVSMEESLVKEVWRGAAPKDVDIIMDSEKVDEVKQAMVNFTLPPSSIPEWASNLTEEQWKQKLVERLQHLQRK